MDSKRRSLADEVFEKLKDDIINIRRKPGELITESEVAERFNISKTPAREALNRLTTEGFIESLPHKGYLVKGISVIDLQNLFQFRTILETASIELAIAYGTDEDLQQLETIAIEEFAIDDDESYRRCAEANYKFHVLIAKMSQNPLLEETLSYVLNQLRRVLLMDLRNIDGEEMSRSHQGIVNMMRRKDADGAKASISEHMKSAEQRVFTSKIL